MFSAGAFLLRLDQGRLGEIVGAIADMARDTPGIPGLRGSLGIAYCESDRADDARTLLAREIESGFADMPYDQFWVVTLVQWALVVDHLRDPRAAELIVELLTPWADQFAFTGVHFFGSVRHALAVCTGALSRYDEAEHHFAEALRGYERFGAPAWAARLRLGWADTLSARGTPGDDARAVSLAREAGEVGRRLGLAGIQRRSERRAGTGSV